MIFSKMRKRTRKQILLPIIISLLLAFAVIIAVVTQSFFFTFIESSQQYIKQKQKTVNLFLMLIEETSMQFSGTEESYEALIPGLDLIAQMNSNILGTAFISDSGNLYVSSRTAGYPQASVITEMPIVRAFLNGDTESFWFIRNENIAEYYNNKRYDSRKGIITFIRRESGGTLFIDIDPAAIFDIINESSNAEILETTLLYRNDLYLRQEPDSDITESQKSEIKKALKDDDGYIPLIKNSSVLFSVGINADISISAEISYRYVTKQLTALFIPIAALVALFSVMAILSAVLLTRTITHPLERLYHKMQQEKLTTVGKE